MRTRRLGEDDWIALRALRLHGLENNPRDFGASFEAEAAWPEARWRQSLRDVVWIGAETEAGLIGCLVLRQPEHTKLRHNGWIHAMYVTPEFQGSGVADALMNAAEDTARAMGIAILKLLATEGNARACSFYHRRGFVVYGVEPDSHRVDGVSLNSVEMAKSLV